MPMTTGTLIRKLAALAFLAAAALASASAFAQPMLRPAVSVDADVIRLGDLFSDAGPRAADVVAPAPPPGSRTLFDAAWLAATAREHQLDWRPASSFDQASVERATRVVSGGAVAQALLAEIAKRQSVAGAQIQLDNPAFRLVAPASPPSGLDIEGLTVDPRTGRFSAMVAAPGAASSVQRVTGLLIRMIKLPVLDRAVAPGETIAAGDVSSLSMRADRVGPDMILDPRELIGKTPRRLIHAEEPLRSADVQTPIVVHKGDLVTIVLEARSMRLTAQGKALSDGSMGSAVRIANTKSNRVIDATVAGPNLVAVVAPSQFAAR
jgi:flagellar basal body P-ring formation protein FlgA